MANRKASTASAEPAAASRGDPYGELVQMPIDQIIAGSPGQNVRERFDQDALDRLAQSIKQQGILEPLVVRGALNAQGKPEFHLVAGERRLRAARMADLTHVPAIVREIDPTAAAKLNIIENLQRQDLDPIEEAHGYQRLIDEHGMRAVQIARELGVSESHIANRRRLLRLPGDVQAEISRENLSASVALSLVDLADNPDITARAAAELIRTHATQETAKEAIQETLLMTCPVVSETYSAGGPGGHTCDPSAHEHCACRRHVKPRYYRDFVVCVDPDRFAQVEAEAQARLDAAVAAELEAVKADSESVLNLKRRGWHTYDNPPHYREVTHGYGGGKYGSSACTGDHSKCSCLRLARENPTAQVQRICIDPPAFDKIERAAKREQTRLAKDAIRNENDRLSAWALRHIQYLLAIGLDSVLSTTDLAYLAAWVFSACEPDYSGPGGARRIERRQYIEGLGAKWQTNFANLTGRSEMADALLDQPPIVLLRLIFEWPLLAHSAGKSGDEMRALGHWYRRQSDPDVRQALVDEAAAALGLTPRVTASEVLNHLEAEERAAAGDVGDEPQAGVS